MNDNDKELLTYTQDNINRISLAIDENINTLKKLQNTLHQQLKLKHYIIYENDCYKGERKMKLSNERKMKVLNELQGCASLIKSSFILSLQDIASYTTEENFDQTTLRYIKSAIRSIECAVADIEKAIKNFKE